MYRILNFTSDHYYLADLEGNDAELRCGTGAQAFVTNFLRGPAYTILYKDTILVMGGVMPYWDKVGEAWFIITPHVRDHTIYALKAVMRLMKLTFVEHQYNRIQASVAEDFKEAIRLTEWLGFKSEGRMPYYGADGGHFIRYAVTLEDNPWQ